SDAERIVSDFPRKRSVQNAFYPSAATSGKLKQQIDSKGYWAVEPGAVFGDSVYMLSVLKPAPYQNTSSTAKWYITAHQIENGVVIDKMELSADAYSLKHPAISGKEIYVSSDRPGGYGGFDIWKASWDRENYGSWKNLGEVVNSAANEFFPTFHGDTLLFASDQPGRGYGGYDIYGYIFGLNRAFNMGIPVNSPYDDFNPIGVNGTLKYISSAKLQDRDMDVFRVEFFDPELFFSELFGRIQSENGNLRGKIVTLINSSGTYRKDLVLDENGYFRIHHLKGLEDYQIKLNDLHIGKGSKLLLYNDRGVLIKDVAIKEGKPLWFSLLAPEDYYLEKLENSDESILEVDILGAVETDDSNRPPLVIYLEDSKGELIGISKTDSSGLFSFNSVLPDDRYTIRTEVRDPNATIRIFNAKGEELQIISPDHQSAYIYVRLTSEDDVITITNEENINVKISQREVFNLPTIYYGVDEYALSKSGKEKMRNLLDLLKNNPGVSIELSGHTDARGDAAYNLRLSQKRIDAVMDFLEASGINRTRFRGSGYGEKQLLNHCTDGTTCTEKEHAVNRRTEIRIFQDPLKQAK
ncbi:MAG TPA: OmpA family protein, partial [Cryomorphaceae bacterium]|nr:OmpA family protein [Cryomorphaceae bacterium]